MASDSDERPSIAGHIASTLSRLDPNMLAIMLLVIVLNGALFYALDRAARAREAHLSEVVRICISPLRLAPDRHGEAPASMMTATLPAPPASPSEGTADARN